MFGLAVLALTGCRTTSRPPMPAAVVTPPPQERVSAAENPGSLVDPDGATMLFADARAKRVGDVLLIKVVESTLSKSKADHANSGKLHGSRRERLSWQGQAAAHSRRDGGT
jgi:flagellar L-ring protein FlgH